MKRFKWWFADRVERFRWLSADVRDAIGDPSKAKVAIGAVVLLALLAGGYFAAARVSQAGAGTSSSSDLVRLVTTVREPVTTRINGHTVVRWRVRRKVVEAQAHTVMRRETVKTPSGTKVVTRPVVTYRKKVVKVGGKTSTVSVRQTVTNSQTNTVSRTVTDVQTITRPVTVVETQTDTQTQTQTVVTTVTLPGTTITVTLPGP